MEDDNLEILENKLKELQDILRKHEELSAHPFAVPLTRVEKQRFARLRWAERDLIKRIKQLKRQK